MSAPRVAVIGTGRVGLPLALAFIEAGAEVIGVDIDPRVRRIINEERRMPFHEPGFEDAAASGKLRIVERVADAGDVDVFVITVGTPLLHHIETDLSAVTRVIAELSPSLRAGHCVIMRSTTAPRTTRYVRTLLERHSGLGVGTDLALACCPERIVEGKAHEELRSLPQVIGTEDPLSRDAAARLFGLLGVELLHCDYITAELVKLANNVSRYAFFATANVLAMIALDYDAEPHEVLRLGNYRYPRPIGARPGLTAGTCLRKDFGMLSEAYWSSDILIDSWRINESMPKFLVDAAKRRWGPLAGERALVLGYSFKRDTDDVRDSLSAKLLRYLQRECPARLAVHDPWVSASRLEPLHELRFETDLLEALDASSVAFIATNHTVYEEQREAILARVAAGSLRVVDLWNCLGTGHTLIAKDGLR
ncbi:MAG: nucleotide sugar dehydrogenase [Polyangiaceae bacterium]|nr:nucleotide sugar dehydrogenase [Polyangiaceae bacterium]